MPTVDTLFCSGGICTLDSGATINTAEARVVEAHLAQGNVIVKTSDSDVLTLLSPVRWSSNRSLTLQTDNDIQLFGGISASQGKLIIDNPGHDYQLRKPVNLSAGQNFRVNGEDFTVITSLGQPGSTTGADLQGISGNMSGNYALGSDIDASATSNWNSDAGFYPISTFGDVDPFTGKLDGLGHVIRSIRINRPTFSYIGLFAVLEDASIKHLALEDFQVTGKSDVGSFAGVAEGTTRIAQSCVVGGSVTAKDQSAGAYFGERLQDTEVTDSCILGTSIIANEMIGGMVGLESDGTLTVVKSYAFRLKLLDNDGDPNFIGFLAGGSNAEPPVVSHSLVNYQNASLVPSDVTGATTLRLIALGDLSNYQDASWDISTDPDSNSLWYLDQSYDHPAPAMLRMFDLDLTDFLYDS
ncbi:ZmpA/ZmpB/ZmpC family metallo-endopeptidase-related protein [Saccharospirillum mangrovi]|uniref:ZmpA/ZmpB/ZmpC family metallo-endopeptidase-related protein n=1 Tax=Saccharospirillum mangrovi TaxID=2161747 RepID=UPI00130031AE|nr:ZmpA/ZmpB/ZmpC family metallo-endopeptidase-related protein [Saccharospirillum mangrovi]